MYFVLAVVIALCSIDLFFSGCEVNINVKIPQISQKIVMDDEQSNSSEPIARLKDGFCLKDLMSDGGTTFEVNFEELNQIEDDRTYEVSDVWKYCNKDCLGVQDDDVYNIGEPFDQLAEKMTNVTEDGKVKKRILHEGYGVLVPKFSMVTVNYNAYVEYDDEPFDSTYIRKKPLKFRVNNGQTIPGLDLAVQTMKINEKSQFLIDPILGYGKLGCLDRIPPNAVLLFEIEVITYVDSGACVTYENLDTEKRKEFSEIYKYALALCSKGNDYFGKGLLKHAIRDYNIAVSKLEVCTLRHYDDEKNQQILLLRLLTNLVVCYTKLGEARKTCTRCNNIYNLTKGTNLKVPAKVYFNNGKALVMLAEYEWAEKRLLQAQKIEPHNEDISRELIKLEARKKEERCKESTMVKAMFKNRASNADEQFTEKFESSVKIRA